jgi:small subunit ribosomal protein S8
MKQTLDITKVRYSGQISDPVSDMLARLRNGMHALHDEVAMPSSKLLVEIARLLKREGYIEDYRTETGDYCNVLIVRLKYSLDRKPVITGLKRISKPGRRQYSPADKLPRVLGGLGVAIVSTSKGLMTSKEAAGHKVGGEVICWVW